MNVETVEISGNLGPEYDGSSSQEYTITEEKGGSGSGGGGDDNLGQYDPFIQGLLKRLPNSDSEWSMKDRANWLIAAKQIFKLIYKEKSGDQYMVEVRLVGDSSVEN